MSEGEAAICVSPDADELQRFAADELRGYLKRLFGVDAKTVVGPEARAKHRFVLGLSSDALVRQAAKGLPELSSQGHLVRRVSESTMVLAGGSSAATAWAVYELVERYGVRYLLHEDVFPQEPGPFRLPKVDETFEPVQKLRSWRQFNDLPTGPAMWSLQQQRLFIGQLFKLKFNGIYLCLWPHHPFVDYEVQGIRRQSACLLFGQKIPIDSENIGREHLLEAPYLNNPELMGIEDFPDLLAAGKRLVHDLIDCARRLGMQTDLSVQPLTFPREFRSLLENPAERIQLGDLVVAERGPLASPNHTGLVRAKIAAYLEEYGEVDELVLHMPEHPQADRTFQQCWDLLAAKYGLEPEFNSAELLGRAQRDYLNHGGPERAEREFKSTVSMLQFFDEFFAVNDLLQQAAAKDVKVGFSVGTSAVQTYPFIDRVLWPGAILDTNLEYTSSRAVRKLDSMEDVDASKVPVSLTVTLQDDNVGSLPQVATDSIHVLLQTMHRLGWRGYRTRYWPVGDLDPAVAYLARASWDAAVTPHAAYRDHVAHVYGEDSVEPFRQVMRMLEDATVILDLNFMGLLFPVLGTMTKYVTAKVPMAQGLFHVRAIYEQAHRTLERLTALPGPPGRRANLDYWTGRLGFSVHVLREVELLCEGAVEVLEVKAALESADRQSAGEHAARARESYRRAIEEGKAAVSAAAANVRDDSDRASLAAYYHFLVREVLRTSEEYLEAADQPEGGKE